MATRLETVNDLNFEQEVLGSQLPYLLEFSATWCAPCRALEPILVELATEYGGRLRVGKVDMEDAPLVAARLGVRGAPTVVAFRAGSETGRRLGLTNKQGLIELANTASIAP